MKVLLEAAYGFGNKLLGERDFVWLYKEVIGMGNYSVIFGEDSSMQENRPFLSGVEKKTENVRGKDQEEEKKTFYAGNLLGNRDTVSRRFAMKQKEAMKRVMDQFKSDLQTDDEMKEMTEHAETLGDVIREKTQQIQGVDERRAEIQERYGIDPDSQEQKDLELIQKANMAKEHPFEEAYQLTEEEQERYDNLPPMTAYQQEMLECDEEEKKYRGERESARIDAIVDKETVHATQKALLKVTAQNSMVGAQADAKKMMESALDQVVSGLVQEGVDKVDENMKETQEEMAENQEEALEKKIELEKMKEEEVAQEEARQELQSTVLSAEMQAVSGTQRAVENLQANIKSLVQDQVMLDVDMKGLRVNQKV